MGYASHLAKDLGHVAFETDQRSHLGAAADPVRQRLYGDDTAREIDCAVRNAVRTAFDRPVAILQQNRVVLEESARRLLQKETLETRDLHELFQSVTRAPMATAVATER